MKRIFFILLAMPLSLACPGADSAATVGATSPTTSVPEGWLQLPTRELVLDIQHESLGYGARREAGEFVTTVLNLLLGANYSVRLSDEFLRGEIGYYRTNLVQEAPVEMSGAVLKCLESARASGVLDWDCFRTGYRQATGLSTAGRHLPWTSPPFKAKQVSLARADATNLCCLHLRLKWSSRDYGGAVQHERRPGGLTGETVLTEGRKTLWAFSAEMRLSNGEQTLFEKEYPREDWQNSYVTIYEQPLWKTSQALLQDLTTGLRPKPAAPVEATGKKKKAR